MYQLEQLVPPFKWWKQKIKTVEKGDGYYHLESDIGWKFTFRRGHHPIVPRFGDMLNVRTGGVGYPIYGLNMAGVELMFTQINWDKDVEIIEERVCGV